LRIAGLIVSVLAEFCTAGPDAEVAAPRARLARDMDEEELTAPHVNVDDVVLCTLAVNNE
jgi:hypothetical protein